MFERGSDNVTSTRPIPGLVRWMSQVWDGTKADSPIWHEGGDKPWWAICLSMPPQQGTDPHPTQVRQTGQLTRLHLSKVCLQLE